MEQLLEWDRDLLLFFNGFHSSWADPVMLSLTRTEVWIPLYAFFIYLIFRNYGKKGWIVLLGVVVTIVLADQITSSIMKPFFQRLRPSHEPGLEGVIHLVNGYRGGTYGFASSHAANTFGIATFLFLLFRSRYRWITLVFIWAALMTYTRLYLGVHYPGDILAGGLVGMGSGFLGFRVLRLFPKEFPQQTAQ